ncbi:MAG: hypothetical protein ACRC4H_02750 [Plesiomonas sp.]
MTTANTFVPCEKCGGNVIEYTRFFDGWMPLPRKPKIHRDRRGEFGLPLGGEFFLCSSCEGGVKAAARAVIAPVPAASQTPAVQSAAAPSNALAKAMQGAVWPAYNPLTGEDLTDQLRAALEANHKKAIILTLEDAYETLKDLWEENGTQVLKTADKGNTFGGYGAAIYKSYDLVKQFGDYGVKADVFTSKGKEYIAITTKNNGDSVLRHVLVNGVRLKVNGHKYRINNPKVYQLGLTPQSRAAGFKGSTAITFILSAAINTNELVFNDAYYLTDWFGNVGTDLFKAALAFGVGEVAISVFGSMFSVPVLLSVIIIVGVSMAIDFIFDEFKVSEKLILELKSATK